MNTKAPHFGEKSSRSFVVLLLLLLVAIIGEAAQLTPKLVHPTRSGALLDKLRVLTEFEGRDLSLPVVLVTSSLVNHSIEYNFAPSKTTLRVYMPKQWQEGLAMVDTEQSRSLLERLTRWQKAITETGMVYEGDHMLALNGEPGYVVTFELALEAAKLVQATPELELVHTSADGSGSWYLSR
jgi:hypothetical protein